MAAGAPTTNEIVTGVFAASAGLAGFTLVFLGIVLSSFQSYPPGTSKTVLDRQRRPVVWALIVFFLGLATVAVSFSWLLVGPSDDLYYATVGLFLAQLVSVIAIAGYATVKVLW